MGLIEELKEIDEERINNNTGDKKEKYKAKKTALRNRERLKKILEDENPELDEPIFVKITKPERLMDGREGERKTYHSVLTSRTMEILKLIEKFRVEKWGGTPKITYKRSYRKPSRDKQETMRYIEKKVKAIYSSNEGNNKCIAAISENLLSKYGSFRVQETLPILRCQGRTIDKLAVDTKLKYALLVAVSDEHAFQYITQKPEEIQNYETTIKDAETIIKDYEEMHPKQESDSKITFATIKSAIKEHLLGKGER